MVVLNRRKNETNYQSDEHGIKFKITSKFEKNTKQFEPYMEKMQDAITAIAGASKNSSHPMLRPRQVQRSGYLVITSDKGLAGAYSSNVLKRLINDIKEKHTSSDEYSIIVLGQSGVDFLKIEVMKLRIRLLMFLINLHLNQYKQLLNMRLTYSVKNILTN